MRAYVICILLAFVMPGCDEMNLKGRGKYTRAERFINDMECHYSSQGVCACVTIDFSIQGGTGVGLAIDSSGKACANKKDKDARD